MIYAESYIEKLNTFLGEEIFFVVVVVLIIKTSTNNIFVKFYRFELNGGRRGF